MKLTLLDEWMKEWEANRLNQLKRTQELRRKWREAIRSQQILNVVGSEEYVGDPKTDVVIPEMINYHYAKVSPNWKRIPVEYKVFDYETNKYVTKPTTIIVDMIEVEGNSYPSFKHGNYRFKSDYNGLTQLLKFNGLSLADSEWFDRSRTDEEIEAKAHKDMLDHKKAIESKVRKICGDTLTNIQEFAGEIFCKGSNGRTAHLWAIEAGGYNIQCLHIRVLVKEVKEGK